MPALVLISGLSMKRAVGTSLSIVALKSFAGFVGYAGAVHVDYKLIVVFTAIAIAGSFAGSAICHKLHVKHLQQGFSVFLAFVASYILLKSVLF